MVCLGSCFRCRKEISSCPGAFFGLNFRIIRCISEKVGRASFGVGSRNCLSLFANSSTLLSNHMLDRSSLAWWFSEIHQPGQLPSPH